MVWDTKFPQIYKMFPSIVFLENFKRPRGNLKDNDIKTMRKIIHTYVCFVFKDNQILCPTTIKSVFTIVYLEKIRST